MGLFGSFASWEAIAACTQAFATVLALFALIMSIYTFRKSLRAIHYAELDKMYFEILGMAMDKPYLRDPKSIKTPDQTTNYEIYALILWNFLETVHDRCERDDSLCRTWYPTIAAENCPHRKWFNREDNCNKFKPEFRKFINSGAFKTLPRSRPRRWRGFRAV